MERRKEREGDGQLSLRGDWGVAVERRIARVDGVDEGGFGWSLAPFAAQQC